MNFTELIIQTQRESPNNARNQGIAILVYTDYKSREREFLLFGQRAFKYSQKQAYLLRPVQKVGQKRCAWGTHAPHAHRFCHLSKCRMISYVALKEIERLFHAESVT